MSPELFQLPVVERAQLGSAPLALDRPVAQVVGPVDEVGQVVQPVLRHQHRAALALPALDGGAQVRHRGEIQVRRRLVQHHQPWPGGGGAGAGDALLLPAGQVEKAPPHERLQLERRGCGVDAPFDLGALHALVLAAEGQLAAHVDVEELGLRVLEHRAYEACRVVQRCVGRVQPAHAHSSFHAALVVVGREAVGQAGERGLAAARRAAQQHHLAGRRLQVDAAHAGTLPPVRVGERNVFHDECGLAGRARASVSLDVHLKPLSNRGCSPRAALPTRRTPPTRRRPPRRSRCRRCSSA